MEMYERKQETIDMISYSSMWRQTNKTTVPKEVRFFLKSAGVLLIFSAIAKLISASGSARILEENDPIFPISFRITFWLAGSLELVIALICFFCKRYEMSILLTTWIATCFAFYRFSLWWIGWHRPCSCLGNLTDALHISPQIADTAMKTILAYLLLGSYASLFWLWRQKRKTPLAPPSSKTPASPV
jgi:hypothetical protein